MQYQSNLLGVPVKVSRTEDLAAWGVARLAMLANGLELSNIMTFAHEYHPQRNADWRAQQRTRWQHAIHLAETAWP